MRHTLKILLSIIVQVANLKISVFGLGYVGVVSCACLAKMGHSVISVDVQTQKIDLINQGLSPIIEQDINEIIAQARLSGNLSATFDVDSSVLNSDISLICVGTPSQPNGSLDLQYIRRVCTSIGEALAKTSTYHLVILRSTVLPGSMHEVVIPLLQQASGKTAGVDFGIAYNPEFLREGTAVYDFYNPPKTVFGFDKDEKTKSYLLELYKDLPCETIITDIKTAEMLKYTDNVWHGLKVGFANEIGNICKAMSIDSHTVMEIFCKDTKLNLSSYYLKPGFAFGGSCLPKDIRALSYKAKTLDLTTPILNSILPSNRLQIDKAYSMVVDQASKNVGVLGISFKVGTDDLRESPIIDVIEKLIGKGYNLKLYDRNVRISGLMGANKNYILNQIPHISSLMVESISEVLKHADIIIVSTNENEFKTIATQLRPHQVLIDLVRLDISDQITGEYNGICW